jgi:ABC-2 type transport system permease protein
VSKVWQVAIREFVATVFTRAFIIGLLVFPALVTLGVLLGPRLFAQRAVSIEGQVAVVDPTGKVASEWRSALTEGTPAAELAAVLRAARIEFGGDNAITEALGAAPKIELVERPADADVEQEKTWLDVSEPATQHLALAVIHANAVEPNPGETALGSYDLYVPPGRDQRTEIAVHQGLREAIIAARMRTQGLDRAQINALVTVPRVRAITVTKDGDRRNVGALNFILPFAFVFLLFMGIMGSGQGMLTTTIEEKSSRVIEVLLSAVSPMQLMAGKLLGHMGISLVGMTLYLVLGLVSLASFSLFGLLDISLIFYLFVFFLIGFFTIGSLMMAAGAAVNDMREAQSLMMPLTFVLIAPWFLMMPISRNADSTLSVIVSFVPPLNTFGMLTRLASTSPPPGWQVWLSIAIGVVGVVAAVWLAAKVFRIGLLMFGKPPDLKTLWRWIRAS